MTRSKLDDGIRSAGPCLKRLLHTGLLAAALILVAPGPGATADEIATALVPTEILTTNAEGEPVAAGTPFPPKPEVTLVFSGLPRIAGAVVERAALQLVCLDDRPKRERSTLETTLTKNKKTARFGDRSVDGNEPLCTAGDGGGNVTPLPERTIRFNNEDGDLIGALLATPRSSGIEMVLALIKRHQGDEGRGRRWVGLDEDHPALQPRLILDFTLPGYRHPRQAGEPPAAHSEYGFLPAGGTAKGQTLGFVAQQMLPPAALWSYTPVFRDGLVIAVIDQDGYRLNGYSPLSAGPLWSVDLGGSPEGPGQHILATVTGRLYLVGKGRIDVFEWPQGDARRMPVRVPTAGQPGNGLDPTLPPAAGPDGSIYLVLGTRIRAFNPAFQEIWSIPLPDGPTSAPTVGPDGRRVYVVAAAPPAPSSAASSHALYAIDALTGFAVTAPVNTNITIETLNAPVVIRHPDGVDKIYVTARGENQTGVLARFDLDPTSLASSPPAIPFTLAPEPKQTTGGRWGRLIVDRPARSSGDEGQKTPDRHLYAVHVPQKDTDATSGALVEIDWLSPDATRKVPGSGPIDLRDPDAFLLVDSYPLMSGAGAPLYWDGTAGDAGLLTVSARDRTVAEPVPNLPKNTRLHFGTDGTLYAAGAASSTAREFSVLMPSIRFDGSAAGAVWSPTHLHVAGQVPSGSDLAARGSVLLKRGTTLAPGTTVRPGAAVPGGE